MPTILLSRLLAIFASVLSNLTIQPVLGGGFVVVLLKEPAQVRRAGKADALGNYRKIEIGLA